jgi:hypothetical protein
VTAEVETLTSARLTPAAKLEGYEPVLQKWMPRAEFRVPPKPLAALMASWRTSDARAKRARKGEPGSGNYRLLPHIPCVGEQLRPDGVPRESPTQARRLTAAVPGWEPAQANVDVLETVRFGLVSTADSVASASCRRF